MCHSCACNPLNCPNRVVGNSGGKVQFNLEVFHTRSAGLALKTREAIEKGKFVLEYSGETVRCVEDPHRDSGYFFDRWYDGEEDPHDTKTSAFQVPAASLCLLAPSRLFCATLR